MPVAMENGSIFVRSELLQSYHGGRNRQMKLATLKGNNCVLSFRDELNKNYIMPLLHVQLKKKAINHCKAEDLYFHYQYSIFNNQLNFGFLPKCVCFR